MASSSTPLLSVAADIIITLTSSSSSSNKINTTGYHVTHNSSPTRDSALPDSSFISLEKGDKAVSEGSDRLKVELPFFSLSLSAVLPHAYLVHLIRYITFIKEFSATRFDPIPISFQTSVSTFM